VARSYVLASFLASRVEPAVIPRYTAAMSTGSFEALGLHAPLVRAVEAAGFAAPTPIQLAAIPAMLSGRDVLARAQTGSGKTAAFGLPLLQRFAQRAEPPPRGNHALALVLVPTRELAMQISEVLSSFAHHLPARTRVLAVFGGVSINPQMMALRGGVEILIATPGRLLDLSRNNAVRLSETRVVVLDEADRMLSLGFADELAQVSALLPRERQTLLFSATFPSELAAVIQATLRDPIRIELEAEPTLPIEEHVYAVDEPRKGALTVHLLKERKAQRALVFVSAKRSGDKLVEKLVRAGITAAVFHGDKSQAERTRCLADFRAGKLRVLVATDLAARGIDIDDLPFVINYELPRSPNDYVHRIGRTGRAGKAGVALTLICQAEQHHFGVIEKRIKRKLLRETVAGFEPAGSVP
jgi:ATP-dependent RNA helicase RhlE